jgi:5'-nucleotidase
VQLRPGAGRLGRHWCLAAVAAGLAALGGCTGRAADAAPAPPAGTVTLSIVGTNDLHGGILQSGDRGGLALLGGYLKNLRAARAKDGGAVLLLDAGDMFQGTLESNLNEGAAVVAAYNALGYDAAAVGNHEFDFGPAGPEATPQASGDDPRGALKARAAQARFPFLAANLIDEATGRPVAWPNVAPSTVVMAAGARVGLIGVMTEEALTATIAPNVTGLRVAPLAATIGAEAERLRAGGATVVLVMAHAGGRCTDFSAPADLSSCSPSHEIMQVARAMPRGLVDAIIAGHSHAGMGHLVEGIAISEAYSGGRAFGRVDLMVDRASGRVVDRRSFPPRDLCARVDPGTTVCDPVATAPRATAEYEGAPVAPEAAIAAVIAPAVDAARARKTQPLGVTLAAPIRRAGGVGSPLGNLFADALLAAVPGADVAVNNTSGGIRADLPAGPLTYGAVFEAMPFDNRVVAFRLTGGEVRRVIAGQLRQTAAILGLAGLRVRAACRAGALDVELLRPGGAPVRDDDRLLVATSDFLATGGDRVFEPVLPGRGFAIEQDAGYVRDAVIASIRSRNITREEQLIDAADPRWTLPGQPPLSCGA